MKITISWLYMLALILICASIGSPVLADPPPPEYIQFSPSATKGALYYPDPALYPNPHVAVIIMHRNSNYLSHLGTREFPEEVS